MNERAVMPVPLVVFSGGLDSTFLLYKTLLDGNVETCYFDAGQHFYKVKAEMLARSKIVTILERITGNRVMKDTFVRFPPPEVKVLHHYSTGHSTDFGRENIPNGTWGQAYLWMFGLLKVTDPHLHSKVRMGYVMGDEIAMHYDNLKLAWRSLQAFTKHVTLELEFPLATMLKESIVRDMPHDVMKHLWHCELPIIERTSSDGSIDRTPSLIVFDPETRSEEKELTYVPCKECVPCRTKMKYAFMWEHDHRDHETLAGVKFDDYFAKDLPAPKMLNEDIVSELTEVNTPDEAPSSSGIKNDTLKGEIFTLNETQLEVLEDFNYADMFRIYDEQNDLTRQQGVVTYLINNGFAIDVTMGKGAIE